MVGGQGGTGGGASVIFRRGDVVYCVMWVSRLWPKRGLWEC